MKSFRARFRGTTSIWGTRRPPRRSRPVTSSLCARSPLASSPSSRQCGPCSLCTHRLRSRGGRRDCARDCQQRRRRSRWSCAGAPEKSPYWMSRLLSLWLKFVVTGVVWCLSFKSLIWPRTFDAVSMKTLKKERDLGKTQ